MKKLRIVVIVIMVMIFSLVCEANSQEVKLNLYNCAGYEGFYMAEVIPAFEKAYPDIKIKCTRVKWAELISKLEVLEKVKKLEPGKNSEIQLVIMGCGDMHPFLKANYAQKLWPNYKEEIPNVNKLIDIGKDYIKTWDGKGITCHIDYYPLLLRNPNRIKEAITDVSQLQNWIRANPGKFMYGRPANSGAGRTFVWGLASALGEDTNHPEEWVKTWEYLKSIDPYIKTYPSGTSPTFRSLAMGEVDIIPLGVGWQAELKHFWAIPPDTAVDTEWTPVMFGDAHAFFVPSGVSQEVMEAALKFINFTLSDDVQAMMAPLVHYPATLGGWEAMSDKYKHLMTELIGKSFPEFVKEAKFEMLPSIETMTKTYDLWDKKIGSIHEYKY